MAIPVTAMRSFALRSSISQVGLRNRDRAHRRQRRAVWVLDQLTSAYDRVAVNFKHSRKHRKVVARQHLRLKDRVVNLQRPRAHWCEFAGEVQQTQTKLPHDLQLEDTGVNRVLGEM